MTETVLIAALSILVVYPYLLKWKPTENKIFLLVIAFCLGLGLTTFVYFLLNLGGVKFSLYNMLLINILLICLAVFSTKIFPTVAGITTTTTNLLKASKVFISRNKLLSVIMLFLVFASFVINYYWPVKDWDSLVLYDFRAQLFARHGGMTEAISQGYFVSYPLMTSLAHTFVYLVNIQASPMLLYTFFYCSLLIGFYFVCRRLGINEKVALISTTLLALSRLVFEHSTWSYTNLPYTLYFFLSYSFLLLWHKFRSTYYLILSFAFLALSTWIRFAEPFWLLTLILAVGFSIYHKEYIKGLMYVVGVLVFRSVWLQFSNSVTGVNLGIEQNINEAMPGIAAGLNLANINTVLSYLIQNSMPEYGIYILLLSLTVGAAILAEKKVVVERLFELGYIILLYAMVFAGTLLFSISQSNYWNNIGDSVRRMLMVVVPLSLLGISKNIQVFTKLKK